MNGADNFLRMLQHEQSWSTANRQLRFAPADGKPGEVLNLLLPQRVYGSEAICGGVDYRIACLASTPNLPLKDLIAMPIEIQILTDRGQLRSVCGIVTEAASGGFDGGIAVYHLVVRDALAVMEKRTSSRIFRYQNELEIVQILVDEWRHSNFVLATTFELELDPMLHGTQFPPREQTMQYNESDAAFVRRLLKRCGIAWFVKPGRSRTSAVDRTQARTPAHTLVLFNAANSLQQNTAGTVRFNHEIATDGRDVITSWSGERKLQPGSATRHSWDYKNPGGSPFMTVSARGGANQGSYGNALAATLDDYLVDIPHAGNDTEDLQRLGQLRMSRHELDSKCFYGEGCVRDFCAGEYFTLTGHPEVDTHSPDEREFVITDLELEARNNLPKDLAERANRLLADARPNLRNTARSGLVQVSFTAVRRGVPIVPAFDPRIDLPSPQLQSAIVVGPPGEVVYCDALGRVKIRFPGMRAADHAHAHGAGASDGPGDSAWVRVSTSWAGNGPSAQQQAGTLTLPRVGTEVLVAFLGGDPDRPVIVGQLFNQVSAPPAFSGQGTLPGNRYLSGMRTREIQGNRSNQLRFDDTRGQVSAQLASDHGASELNLGFLTRPRANGHAEPRGEGAELRSDEAVAIRGGKGVLITAEDSSGADGRQLARPGLIGLADMLQGVVAEVGKLAEHHSGDESTGRLTELADKIRQWHDGSNVAPDAGAGGAPIVAVTAPAGIAVASADSLVLGAERKVTVACAGDAEVSAGRNIFVRAARGLSMFAHALGIKLVAGRGNVSIQAHQGNIEIKASGRISLIATEGIDLQAPEVKVVAQGAQTDWGHEGGITQQCAGRYVVKAAQSVRLGPAGATPAILDLPATTIRTDERAVLRDEQTGEAIRNRRYQAQLADGRTVEGTTDDRGRTSLIVGEAMGDIHFIVLPDEPQH